MKKVIQKELKDRNAHFFEINKMKLKRRYIISSKIYSTHFLLYIYIYIHFINLFPHLYGSIHTCRERSF